jgi:hypothetical protein
MVSAPSWLRFKKWRLKNASGSRPAHFAEPPAAHMGSASMSSLAASGGQQATPATSGELAPAFRQTAATSKTTTTTQTSASIEPPSDERTISQSISEQRELASKPAGQIGPAVEPLERDAQNAYGRATAASAQANNNQEVTSMRGAQQAARNADADRGRARVSNRRRLGMLVPRVLSNLIERAVSPNVRQQRRQDGTTAASGQEQQQEEEQQREEQQQEDSSGRPKSPLRKFHKHFKQKQEPTVGREARLTKATPGPLATVSIRFMQGRTN